jgi:hypothetical protein
VGAASAALERHELIPPTPAGSALTGLANLASRTMRWPNPAYCRPARESRDRYTVWPAGPQGLSTRVLRDLLLRDDGWNAASQGVTVTEHGLLHRDSDELSLVLLGLP